MLLARTQLLHALVAVFGSPRLPRCRPRDYPRLPEITRDCPRLPEITRELPRAYSQADLALPAPVMLPLFVAILPKLPGEAGGAAGQRAYTSRVCEGVARRVIEVMQAARRGWKEGAGRPRPKAVVFSEFDNDLSQVSSHLTGTLGQSRAISGNLG